MKNPFGIQARGERWYDKKSELMSATLGPDHNVVMHAIIPYAIGGGLDLYYYPSGVPGTGIATKELCELPGQGSSNRTFSCYELVMFTRYEINLDQARDEATAFGKMHAQINSILNRLAPYSAQASLNAYETCEFPPEMEQVGGACLIFDHYGSHRYGFGKRFGLLLAIEIHRSEMEFARAKGGGALLTRLRENRHYPYADLDRAPVA